ncbi:MAG: suppressor of fused domain protein [Planctomycetota bacterium]
MPTEDDDAERAPSGQPVYRYEDGPSGPEGFSHGDEGLIDAVSEHVERHVGPIESVFHEIVSPTVHIDIHRVAPSEDRPFTTLVTTGMAELPMTVPDGLDEWAHAELVLLLPPDWPVDEESWKDERHYWPVRWMKKLARFPHEYSTWFCFGHSMPNGDPPEPFHESTKLCGWLLISPVAFETEFAQLTRDDGPTISFWLMLPLYGEEMDFKLRHETDALLEKLAGRGVEPVLDPQRVNAVTGRKPGRRWRLFGG